MHQTSMVHRGQGPTQFIRHETSLAGAERPVAHEHLLERDAANEFHPEADSSLVFAGPVHGDDVRMTYTSQRPPFVQESGCELLVA